LCFLFAVLISFILYYPIEILIRDQRVNFNFVPGKDEFRNKITILAFIAIL